MLGVCRDTGQRIAPRPHPLDDSWRVRRPPEWMSQVTGGYADPQHVSDHWRVRRPPAWITLGRVVLSSVSKTAITSSRPKSSTSSRQHLLRYV
eukprot:7817448-Karenia_brevis.AAC.1